MDSLHTQLIQGTDYAMLFWTIVIAITGIVGAFIAIRANRINKGTHDLNKNTIELIHKPFIEIESIKCKLATTRIEYPSEISFSLKNSGNLQAKNIQLSCNGKITPIDKPSSEGLYAPIPLPIKMKPSLGVGSSISIRLPIKHAGLDESASFPFNTFEVFFDLRYDDSNGKVYTERYKYSYDRDLKNLLRVI